MSDKSHVATASKVPGPRGQRCGLTTIQSWFSQRRVLTYVRVIIIPNTIIHWVTALHSVFWRQVDENHMFIFVNWNSAIRVKGRGILPCSLPCGVASASESLSSVCVRLNVKLSTSSTQIDGKPKIYTLSTDEIRTTKYKTLNNILSNYTRLDLDCRLVKCFFTSFCNRCGVCGPLSIVVAAEESRDGVTVTQIMSFLICLVIMLKGRR